ncbi:MAG: histidine--tRNA ligase [bacterium]|nr:histidine--tRNA ligase [bacterium]
MNIQTLKGFRDFLPKDARKRQYVIGKLRAVFEKYGFEPLETPALEYEEILMGKYGEGGDKMMYRFEDNGGRRVAMRYDQTVPLSRVVAQYLNEITFPFKRYQIQPVWRAENTQKGRFREFTQCDIDTVGANSALADAEVLATVVESFQDLGFTNFKILINDRENLKFSDDLGELAPDTNIKAVRVLDKLKKIGREGVLTELQKSGFSENTARVILETAEQMKPTQRLIDVFAALKKLGTDEKYVEFSGTLARGLDYYTGIIFETEIESYEAGAVCSGGRYDKLIGMFGSNDIPAVGCAFGFDRILDAMDEQNLFPKDLPGQTQVLVTIFNPELAEESMKISSHLRSSQENSRDEGTISVALWLDETAKMEKQLKYADQKEIPYVIIIGPEEKEKNIVTVRDMKTREQKQMNIDAFVTILKENKQRFLHR